MTVPLSDNEPLLVQQELVSETILSHDQCGLFSSAEKQASSVFIAAWALVLSRHLVQGKVIVQVHGYKSHTCSTIGSQACSESGLTACLVALLVSEAESVKCLISQATPSLFKNDTFGSTLKLAESGLPSLNTPLPNAICFSGFAGTLQHERGLWLYPSIRKDRRVTVMFQSPKGAEGALRSITKCFLVLAVNIFRTLISAQCDTAVSGISMINIEDEQELRLIARPGRALDDLFVGAAHQKFRRQARLTPDLPAVRTEDHSITTYAELDSLSDCLAKFLAKRISLLSSVALLDTLKPIEPSPVIGLCLSRSVQLIASLLAAWKAKLAVVILDCNGPKNRIAYMVQHSRCNLILIDNTCEVGFNIPVIDVGDLMSFSGEKNAMYEANTALTEASMTEHFSKLAVVRYTSGSTGKPKAVLHSHATFVTLLCAWENKFGCNSLLFLDPIFAFSEAAIWPFLMTGGCITVLSKNKLGDLAACINDYAVTDLFITPSALLALTPDDVPALQSIILGGETASQRLLTQWSHRVKIKNCIGSTELGCVYYSNFNDWLAARQYYTKLRALISY